MTDGAFSGSEPVLEAKKVPKTAPGERDKPGGQHMTDSASRPRGAAGAVRRFWPLALLLGGLGLAFAMGWHRYLSFETLLQHRETLQALVADHSLVAPIAFILIYLVATAFSVPGGIFLTIAGGFLFGIVAGAGYAVIGATCGALVVFLAARTALGDLLRNRAGPFLQKMEAGFREDELNYLLVLRLIPIFPFWLVNIVPAFLGVSVRTYLIGTFLGIIPGCLVFTSLGSSLGGLLDAYNPDDPPNLLGIVFEPQNIFPILGLIVLSLLPVFYKRFKARRGDGT